MWDQVLIYFKCAENWGQVVISCVIGNISLVDNIDAECLDETCAKTLTYKPNNCIDLLSRQQRLTPDLSGCILWVGLTREEPTWGQEAWWQTNWIHQYWALLNLTVTRVPGGMLWRLTFAASICGCGGRAARVSSFVSVADTFYGGG